MRTKPNLNLIIATADNGAIGLNNALPWNIKEDLQYFKDNTINDTVVMGSNTFASLKFRPLSNRKNIVLTRDKSAYLHHMYSNNIDTKQYLNNNLSIVSDIQEILAIENQTIWIIGGKQIYTVFFEYVSRMYITYVHKSFKADTYMIIPTIGFNLSYSKETYCIASQCKVTYTVWDIK